MTALDATSTEHAADGDVRLLGRTVAYKYIVAVVYVAALFLDILDTTIVNVALPTLGRDFHSDNAEWVVLGYTLSLAVWIPASGWLGDRIGTKRTFMFAFVAFIFGSLLCASAQSMEQLIAFRVVQGIGGGMLTPVGVAMLFRAFPPAERVRASTYIMIPSLAAPALRRGTRAHRVRAQSGAAPRLVFHPGGGRRRGRRGLCRRYGEGRTEPRAADARPPVAR